MTTKFNKSVLASAIAATSLLAGGAFAADLGYQSQTQITYAKDLIATDSRTIDLPTGFLVRATTAQELGGLTGAGTYPGVQAGDTVEIVISLGQGSSSARFQSNAPNMTEAQLRDTIFIGTQLNAGAAATPLSAIDPAATINYSNGEREMRIRFVSPGGDDDATATDYSFQLPSLRVYDLQGALLEGSIIQGGISITNISTPRTIVAGNAVFARSAWGEVVSTSTVNSNKFIDVQRCSASAPARVLFTTASATDAGAAGTVGTSCPAGQPANKWINVGAINVGLAQANTVGLTGAPALSVVRNFDGVTPWSLISTQITYRVLGTNLAGWNGTSGRPSMWLDVSAACPAAAGAHAPLTVNAAGTVASYSVNVSNAGGFTAALQGLADGTAVLPGSPATLHVCFGANGTTELIPQQLSAEVLFDHQVPALYVNPEPMGGNLSPLRTNAGVYIFQNVNPGGNARARSILRLTNNTAVSCDVAIDAKDDAGLYTGPVRYTMAPHSSEQFDINELETGVGLRGRTLTGSFGDGTGKWYVRVQPECANFNASTLNQNADTGVLTNLTPQKTENWLTPTTRLNP